MSVPFVSASDAEAAAADAVRAVLLTQWERRPIVLLDSPPGAGKTYVVECLAVQSSELLGERCMVVAQTNEQAFDLARRLGRGFPRLQFTLFLRKDMVVPNEVLELGNIRMINDSRDLPTGPSVVIANAEKWAYFDGPNLSFDCQVVDEAYQLPDFRFQQIAGLARRIVLVGDPGQITPVIRCDVGRWKDDPAGPHVPCPQALAARHPDICRLSLPVSRRLPPDTVRIVQSAFYPNLPFVSLCGPEGRKLTAGSPGETPLDSPIDRLRSGASIVMAELPPRVTNPVDEDLANTLVGLIMRLVRRRIQVWDGHDARLLEPNMVGVACAHVVQVNAVRERLPRNMSQVFVETSDRFQGLERPVMLVHHPLSGRVDASRFHLDAGRLCVMMSRHKNACIIVARGGIREMLLRYAPVGDRVLGVPQDPEFEGWRSHLFIMDELRRAGRIMTIPRLTSLA